MTTTVSVREDVSEIDFSDGIQKSLVQSTQLVRGSSIKNAPVKSGTLRRSITVDNKQIKFGIGKVGTNVKYARIQEEGGVIRPKKAKLLSWKSGGKRRFAKQVRIKPKRYMAKALKSNESRILQIFTKNLVQ